MVTSHFQYSHFHQENYMNISIKSQHQIFHIIETLILSLNLIWKPLIFRQGLVLKFLLGAARILWHEEIIILTEGNGTTDKCICVDSKLNLIQLVSQLKSSTSKNT